MTATVSALQQQANAVDELAEGQEVEYEDRSGGAGHFRTLLVRIVPTPYNICIYTTYILDMYMYNICHG